MPLYRKKPVVIEAMEIPATDMGEFAQWMMANCKTEFECADGEGCSVVAMEGTMKGKPGDMLMIGVTGEMYVCDRTIFEQTYEAEE